MTHPAPSSKKPRGAACLYAFPDDSRFARQLARATGIAMKGVTLHGFPDGESLVRIPPPVSDAACWCAP